MAWAGGTAELGGAASVDWLEVLRFSEWETGKVIGGGIENEVGGATAELANGAAARVAVGGGPENPIAFICF